MALAALQIVPAVSIMSSMMMQFLPSILPMMFMISDLFGSGLLLSMIAIGQFSISAMFLARVTLPWSGDTMTRSSMFFSLKYFARIGMPSK